MPLQGKEWTTLSAKLAYVLGGFQRRGVVHVAAVPNRPVTSLGVKRRYAERFGDCDFARWFAALVLPWSRFCAVDLLIGAFTAGFVLATWSK